MINRGHSSLLDHILTLPSPKSQEMSRISRHQSHKLFKNYLTGPCHKNQDHCTSSPHITPNVIYEFFVVTVLPPTTDRHTDP